MKEIMTIVILAASSVFAAPALIPMPNEFIELGGSLELKVDATISYADKSAKQTAEMLADWLRPATGFKLPVKFGTKGIIALKILKDSSLGNEGYELKVGGFVQISAQTPIGLFYGGQTMRQLLPPEIFSQKMVSNDWQIQRVKIRDTPRFGWRGMHLDVGRHFFAADDIKDFIDLLAMHKLNTFHWHLTEDQGWRIEIKKYPRLTEVGAYRASTPPYGNRGASDGKRYGGFYTQKEIRDIVAYAAQRHITIVPEIDMPGHMAAAIASYPEFGCTDVPDYNPEVKTSWGVHPYVLAPSEETFHFVENMLGEICDLFPSKYIHIGGDEAPKGQWKKSKIAQDVIKREGLHNEHDLQSYFIRRVEKMLEKRGRLLIGWDEIREGGLSPNSAVMSWRGVKGGIDSAREGHDVVMAPNSHTYFDHYQNPKNKEMAKGDRFEAIGGFLPINKVYSFDPVLPGTLSPDEQKHVLGVQAQLWTEYMKTWDKVEYMAFPRVSAIAEVAWTIPENKNYIDFVERLAPMRQRYKILGVNAYTGDVPMPPQPLKGVSVATSLGYYAQHQALCVKDGKADTFFWSDSAPKTGDHLTLIYEKALDTASKIFVVTGGEGKQAADILESGVLETSTDGKQWQKIADFKEGKAEGIALLGTFQIRLRSTAQHSKWLIVHEIVVD